MKQYLLFAFGDLKSHVTVENMIETVAGVTHSQFTKFKQNQNYIIFNFETELNHDSLENYINSNLSNVTECHFLMEATANSTIYMDKIDLECFLRLNEDDDKLKHIHKPKNGEIQKNITDETFFKKLFGFDLSFQADEWDEFEDDNDMMFPSNKPKLDLNVILEKISDSGVESLTNEEKKYLKSY